MVVFLSIPLFFFFFLPILVDFVGRVIAVGVIGGLLLVLGGWLVLLSFSFLLLLVVF